MLVLDPRRLSPRQFIGVFRSWVGRVVFQPIWGPKIGPEAAYRPPWARTPLEIHPKTSPNPSKTDRGPPIPFPRSPKTLPDTHQTDARSLPTKLETVKIQETPNIAARRRSPPHDIATIHCTRFPALLCNALSAIAVLPHRTCNIWCAAVVRAASTIPPHTSGVSGRVTENEE